jgi:hypothetical protein
LYEKLSLLRFIETLYGSHTIESRIRTKKLNLFDQVLFQTEIKPIIAATVSEEINEIPEETTQAAEINERKTII